MPKLPQITPKKLLKFFQKQGFIVTRQSGSHTRLVHNDGRKMTIAVHNKPIAPGTLNSILKQANLERNLFLKLYKD
jgi:predicted RNA binding protein YcfA (HicA-like mRNA interferase family)